MLTKIVEAISCHHSFLITSHESPDGDAVGSSLALANYLLRLGKDVTIYLADPVPEIYRFLPLSDRVLHELPEKAYDVCFVLDVGEFRRAGRAITGCDRIGMFVNLDHHKSCDAFGALNLIDPAACATGALVYRLIKCAGHEVDYDTALCIYTSIITDTGSFRYSNSNPEAFSIAAEMVGTGINAWFVAEHLYESQPLERLNLLALALSTLRVSDCGRCASVTVTLDMYEKSGAGAELTDGFVNYPRSIHGVEVAIFFREMKAGVFKVGFRSKGKVDVSALAALFGGGGHHNAAGCVIEGELETVRDTVFAHLRNAI